MLFLGASHAGAAPVVPPDFVVEDIAPGAGFVVPICIAALPDGRVLVGEKEGRVSAVKDGARHPTPVWERHSEVLDSYDRGLLSIAVDPDYFVNHYVYFLYAVDPDSNDVETNIECFGRLTRYQINFTDSLSVDPASRTILLGVDWAHGPLEATGSHTVGALRWGRDGSLLVSTGDGADFTTGPDAGGLQPNAFLPGRSDPADDIGAFRAQSIGSLAGKVLRIDPATGLGYPSNPFWDGDPTSVRSRVWAYGFRNPYRFTVRPGTGSTDPADGDPGVVHLGDVGWNDWEEMDVIASGGFNAGWPCKEGPIDQAEYQSLTPTRLGCDSVGIVPDDPNPASPPLASWHHRLDYVGNPPGFLGNASTGGIFYGDTLYPESYRGKYFHADYGQSWIRVATMTPANTMTSFDVFASNLEGPVDFAREPVTGNILYVSVFTGQVRRIRYAGAIGGNTLPVAIATATPTSGPAPLTLDFDGSLSSDADGDSLSFLWLFGDGQSATIRNPSHTYAAAGSYLAVLVVGDGHGAEGRDSVAVLASPLTAFPSTPVLDDFNRADEPLGPPWTADVAGLAVADSALVQNSGYGFPIWGAEPFGADQEAYVTIRSLTGPAPERDLVLKAQAVSGNAAHIEIRYDANASEVAVGTYDPAGGWLAHGAPIAVTYAAGDRFGARAYANGIVEIYRNAEKVGTRQLVGWPYVDNGGRIGLTLDMVSAGALDDFGGGDVVFAVNHPPVASIDSPGDSTFYAAGDTISLAGSASDPDEPAPGLDYHWDIFLHHNTHLHIAFSFDGPACEFEADDHDDGSGVHYEARLIVTDAGGLADTTSIRLFPQVDIWPQEIRTNAGHRDPATETQFSFQIGHQGAMPAHVSRWILLLDDVVLGTGDTALAPYDTLTIPVVVPGGTFTPGPHTVRAVVDTLGALVEMNESNNVATLALVVRGSTTGVGGAAALAFSLSSARPNPARGETRFALELPRAGAVDFEILDLQGRTIWSEARRLEAGRWTLRWGGLTRAGGHAPAGVYHARVRVDGATFTRRLAVIH